MKRVIVFFTIISLLGVWESEIYSQNEIIKKTKKTSKSKLQVKKLKYKVPNEQLEYRYKLLDEKTTIKLMKRLDTYMDNIVQAYNKKDIKKYDKKMTELLWYSSRLPVYFLEVYHNKFVAKVKKYGISPFLSYYIDYGVRLANIRTKSSLRKYLNLKAIFKPKKKVKEKNTSVFLRKRTHDGFTKYSENVGWITAMLLYSDLGENYAKVGNNTAEGYLRVIGLLGICNEREDKEEERLATEAPWVRYAFKLNRLDMCGVLAEGIQGELQGENFSSDDFDQALGGLGRDGFRFGLNDCLSALGDDVFSEMVGKLEGYMACRSAAGAGMNPNMQKLISMLPYAGEFTSIQYEGLGQIGMKMEFDNEFGGTSTTQHLNEVTMKVNGTEVTGELWEHNETDGNGTVIYESSEFRGQTETGETVTYSYEKITDPGTGTSTATSSTSMEGVGSVSTSTTTDANGNVTSQSTSVTVEFDDGSSTTYTTTVDANGNVTTTVSENPAPSSGESGSESGTATTQPIDDVIIDECAGMLNERPDKGVDITRLDTQIIPAIDSVPTDSDILNCMPETGNTLNRCTSVWLCLEGAVDENCQCTTGGGSVDIPPYGSVCQEIMCPEGGACDPTTGTCRSGSEGGPGSIEPPIPMPFDVKIDILVDAMLVHPNIINAKIGNVINNLNNFRKEMILQKEIGENEKIPD